MLYHLMKSVVLADLLCLNTSSVVERKGLRGRNSLASFTRKIEIYNQENRQESCFLVKTTLPGK